MTKEAKDLVMEEIEDLKAIKNELEFEDILSAKELIENNIQKLLDFFSSENAVVARETIDKTIEKGEVVYSYTLPRGSGKTQALVKKALEQNAFLVCRSKLLHPY